MFLELLQLLVLLELLRLLIFLKLLRFLQLLVLLEFLQLDPAGCAMLAGSPAWVDVSRLPFPLAYFVGPVLIDETIRMRYNTLKRLLTK